MAGKSDGTVYIDTQIDTKGVDSGVKSIQGKLNSAGTAMTKFGGKMSLAVTAPLTVLGGKMVSAASDMEENINKVDVAFGKSSENVKAWAETATESFGLSKNQALEAASLFGDMGTSMGLTQEEASSMSTSLAGLAGDLASFKNIDIDQAMTALNGVFTGETESLKTLGVVMTETNLKQFADDAGLVYEQMSQAEKVQLRYAYVMEMTKNAQGDYARTSEGTANSMRTLQASFENLISELGQNLLPIITPIIQSITKILKKFGEMDPWAQKLVIGIGIVVAAIGPLITGIGGIITTVTTLIPIISMVGAAFLPVLGIIAGVIAAIILLIANWDAIKSAMQSFDEFLTNVFATDFTEIFGPFLGNVLNGFVKSLKDVWNNIKKIFNGIINFITGVFSGDWKKAWSGIKDTFVGIWKLLSSLIKTPINGIIGIINGLIEGVAEGINLVIRSINTLDFDIPDWVPSIGGEHVGFSIPEISPIKIPYLATGAVIPPNAPFMAMLGDQRNGKNLEAPEGLIRQIMREEMANINVKVEFDVEGDPNGIFKVTQRKAREYKRRTGTPAYP